MKIMIMKKRVFYMPCFILISLLIVGCDKLYSPKPEEVLNDFLDANLKGRYEEAYSIVSSDDKKVKSLAQYLSEKQARDSQFVKVLANNVTYKIIEVSEINDTAKALVELTYPNIVNMFTQMLGTVLDDKQYKDGEKELFKDSVKDLKSGDIPAMTHRETYKLIKEEDGWRISLDWNTEQMLAEAEKLKKSKHLYAALDKYRQVLELNSEIVEAKKGLEETSRDIKSFEEKQAYIQNVVLYDLSAKYYDSYLDKRIPGIEFKLRNKGNRSLNRVEVTVYFKDKENTIIYEETYYPVLVTEFSFAGKDKPLKPNYIWQLEEGKFYKVDALPDEWKEGSVSAKITDIEFSE